MSRSLNETEILIRKAAFGAGWPLGLAMDLGRAAAEAYRLGQDGAGQALALLQAPQGAADFAGLVGFFDGLEPGQTLAGPQNPPQIITALAALLGTERGGVFESLSEGWRLKITLETRAKKPARADIEPEDFTALAALAAKIYVPASEASRIAGAGAGLTDND